MAHVVEHGLIPAGAGSTRCGRSGARSLQAHPRRCGEHQQVATVHAGCRGSSPQVRGAPGGLRALPLAVRLIPAGAGSTWSSGSGHSSGAAHPRRCGEHGGALGLPLFGPGSSPQVRGAPPDGCRGSASRGLIPAGAGSTGRTSRPGRRTRAHPRRCGEHRLHRATGWVPWGSSPQVRGALARKAPRRIGTGLIPAGAGSTVKVPAGTRAGRAHPRRCGEHSRTTRFSKPRSGSSPQVRGAPQRAGAGPWAPGLIPAGAGSTVG